MYKIALLVAAGTAALVASPAEARHHHRHYYRRYYSYYSPYRYHPAYSYAYPAYSYAYPAYSYAYPAYSYSYPAYGYSYPSYYGYRPITAIHPRASASRSESAARLSPLSPLVTSGWTGTRCWTGRGRGSCDPDRASARTTGDALTTGTSVAAWRIQVSAGRRMSRLVPSAKVTRSVTGMTSLSRDFDVTSEPFTGCRPGRV